MLRTESSASGKSQSSGSAWWHGDSLELFVNPDLATQPEPPERFTDGCGGQCGHWCFGEGVESSCIAITHGAAAIEIHASANSARLARARLWDFRRM